MRGERRVAAIGAVALVLGLTACAPGLPESVVPGTAITAGWAGELTSFNAAASPTAGNLDVAEMIRADFGDLIDGEFVPDEGFGTATIVGDDPFTVRYDLAEPAWSDGIPLDAADLLLGWAAASGRLEPGGDDADADEEGGAGDADEGGSSVPIVDEFARAIDVTYPAPREDWQRALPISVPAHVVGQRAFGVDDPMEAKQAVITAIEDEDADALAAVADVWGAAFEISDPSDIPADILLSSGPFLVDEVVDDAGGQTVSLVPNAGYRGGVTPQVARIDLVPPGDQPVSEAGERLDIAEVAPIAATREPVEELERQDFTVDTSHDGTMWAVLLNPIGVFGTVEARTAFLHAIPQSTLTEGGAGVWATAYTGTTSMVTAPGSRAYEIVAQDSGFAETLASGDDPPLERERAGVVAGTPVCVLYDRADEFAVGAFTAMQTAAAEAGWAVADCGSDDVDDALALNGWDAVIARVPVPEGAADIAAQWGTDGADSITRQYDPARDDLIAQLARTTDIYEARELRAQIEATIVDAAVALPLVVNPRITVIDRQVTGVTPRTGALAHLTHGAVQWAVVP